MRNLDNIDKKTRQLSCRAKEVPINLSLEEFLKRLFADAES